ncbi:MAG: GDSL-type esterase/lipase family protein [Myxococcota bacterium]
MSQANQTGRAVRIATLVLAAVVIGYAISDHPLYGGLPGFGKGQMLIAGIGLALAACALLPIAWNKIALLLSGSLLFTLAVAEIGGEILLAPRFRAPYEADAERLFKLSPNARSVTTRLAANGGESIYHQINSDGFRGPELEEDPEIRVMVYGDSFIHGTYSIDENTFVGQLDQMLTKKLGREVEVVNAGVSSYGPDQILLRLDAELERYQPDLVLVAVFAGNDYGDLLRNKLFELDAAGKMVPNEWVLAEEVKARFAMSRSESVLKRAVRGIFVKGKNPFVGMDETKDSDIALMDWWLAESKREFEETVLNRDDRVINTHVDHYSADLSLEPGSPSAEYKVRLMNAVLVGIHEKIRSRGIPDAMLFVPHPIDVVEEYACCGRVDRPRFPEYNRKNQVAPLEGLARARSIPFVSFFDPFQKKGAESLYFVGGDDHWNDAGQKFAAELVSDFVVEEGLVRPAR